MAEKLVTAEVAYKYFAITTFGQQNLSD